MGSETVTFQDNPTAWAVRLLLFKTIKQHGQSVQQHGQSDYYFSRQSNMIGSQTITFQDNPTAWTVGQSDYYFSRQSTAWAVRLLLFETIQHDGQSDYYSSRQSNSMGSQSNSTGSETVTFRDNPTGMDSQTITFKTINRGCA